MVGSLKSPAEPVPPPLPTIFTSHTVDVCDPDVMISPSDIPVCPPVYPTILPNPILAYPPSAVLVVPVVCPPGAIPKPAPPTVTDIDPGLFNQVQSISPAHRAPPPPPPPPAVQ